eukprot:COSAG01_NODE_4143_length_5301_cov_13.838908_4_plen_52_part_00
MQIQNLFIYLILYKYINNYDPLCIFGSPIVQCAPTLALKAYLCACAVDTHA